MSYSRAALALVKKYTRKSKSAVGLSKNKEDLEVAKRRHQGSSRKLDSDYERAKAVNSKYTPVSKARRRTGTPFNRMKKEIKDIRQSIDTMKKAGANPLSRPDPKLASKLKAKKKKLSELEAIYKIERRKLDNKIHNTATKQQERRLEDNKIVGGAAAGLGLAGYAALSGGGDDK